MNSQNPTSEQSYDTSYPAVEDDSASQKKITLWTKIGLIAGGVLILALFIGGLILLLQPGTDTGRLRDIFIIFLTLEFFVIGLALIILIVQIARLTLLLQNEVKPILESTTDTVQTLRGTTKFMSEHLVQPIIRLNQYLAGMSKFFTIFRSKDN